MSEHVTSSSEPGSGKLRDRGFTLPELLVTIIVLGSIVAVLSSALIVTFQQRDNTAGRLNVSRAEQSIGMWLPADLASAGEVPSTDPSASPCSVSVTDTAGCPAGLDLSGSNALLLSWTDSVLNTAGVLVVTTTNVSYHFTPAADGLFNLVRIECQSTDGGAWTCHTNVVIHDLPGPPPPGTFTPGSTRPDWVLQVSTPLPPDAIDETSPTSTPILPTKNANRVVVTINGGGDLAGRGGGINQISITAGGTTRTMLPTPSLQHAPTFTQTQSRCGGPITLVVDESNSVGDTDIAYVRSAVTSFIQALAGTPVQIQVVRFETRASILGAPGIWTKYFDMTKDADVTALLAAVPQLDGSWPSGSGGTNWEDAIFRTFYAPDNAGGAPLPITPKMVVFFTDGVPTWDRITKRGTPGVATTLPALPDPGWLASDGSKYSQVAFNRANYWANIWRAADDTKLIGVGVGEDIDQTSKWMANPRAGWHTGWQEQSTFTYQQSGFTYQQLVYLWEQLLTTWEQSTFTYDHLVTTWEQSTFTYEQLVTTYEERQTWDEQYHPNPWQRRTKSPVGAWTDTTRANYDGNVSSGTYEYRINPSGWQDKLRADYDAPGANTTPYENDQWRRSNPSGGWITRTLAQYNANNLTADESDGVRIVQTWAPSTQALYNAGNTTNDSTDGWRRITTGTGWTSITQPVYNTNNTTSDSSDGFRTTTTWTPTTQATYNTNNTTNDSTDGWRRVTTGTGWTPITQAVFTTNNSTSDSTDGFRTTSTWTPITQAAYNAGNTTPDSTDGFQTSSNWTTRSQAEYNAGNTTPDETDGWRRLTTGGSWATIAKAVYDANNTTQDSSDGFRRVNPTGSWVQITQAEYNIRNTTSDDTDGVRVGGKDYSAPYTDYDTEVTVNTRNDVILARFIAGNDNGVPWSGTLNTNEREANMFVQPDWTKVPTALKAVALGECGATLTLQTKLGSSYAVDPFVYQNSKITDPAGNAILSNATVTTNLSATARTFDFDIADGTTRTVEIIPVNGSDLTNYTGGTWSCKAGVTNRPVSTFAVPDSQFQGVRVVVGANEAVSCIHSVTVS